MVTKTFDNLKPNKQAQIYDALVTEFTTYALVDAQVARIIKRAEISRGSFYTYFADINDAYKWVFGKMMRHVHGHRNLESIIAMVQDEPDVYHFLQKYYQINEQFLALHDQEFAASLTPRLLKPDASDAEIKGWLAMTAGHDLMRKFFLYPSREEEITGTYKKINQWLS
ncbi:TetR/AcrR family transcriptional regulator [Weissella ceti]|uniref:TetR/AcrR family transcriptional regulator n=1 Tax=Weissella ceti TaxID=759620 RepID=A0ABT3E3Z9_9LACO|nr:TetR/AcrR family transcriptional regulator [Weissella ceti]MCW0953145.1 TetR/AcrR family transcriptional regulator [Weissella ceti]QVK12665.1 TetR/AcrR family transcriptional regulator [Weissella ceti]